MNTHCNYPHHRYCNYQLNILHKFDHLHIHYQPMLVLHLFHHHCCNILHLQHQYLDSYLHRHYHNVQQITIHTSCHLYIRCYLFHSHHQPCYSVLLMYIHHYRSILHLHYHSHPFVYRHMSMYRLCNSFRLDTQNNYQNSQANNIPHHM